VASLVTYENNRRDFAITNRILTRIEQSIAYPNIDKRKPVALLIYGAPSLSRERPFSPAKRLGPLSDSSISFGVYSCELSRIQFALHLLASDSIRYEVTEPAELDPTTRELVGLRVATMPIWPANGSVEFLNPNRVVIKFGSDLNSIRGQCEYHG